MINKQSTRFYSNRQEKKVAKTVMGVKTPNSGATAFKKGDVTTEDFLLECKTVTKPQKTFTIHLEWIEKNKEEAFAMNKPYSAVVIQFEPDGENYYVIEEKLFKMLMNYIQEEN